MIALLSDFSQDDHFVGVMKGVIHSIHPAAQVVDLCHGIPSYFIHAASFVLEKNFRFFPPSSIFIAVVDPGVGTDRKILLAYYQKYLFIAPDNGILTPMLVRKDEVEVRNLEADHFFLQKEHSTFEARDRMAPVAAQISKGLNWQFMGERIEQFAINDDYFPRTVSERQVAGMIVYIDAFGNIITNIPSDLIHSTANRVGAKSFKTLMGGSEITDWRRNYAGTGGKPFMLIGGSHGNLEIAFTQKPAAKELKVSLGQPVMVQFS